MSNSKAGKAHYHKIRQELSARLGFGDDPDALPIDQQMRLDVIVQLKLALDQQRARQYRGEPIETAEMLRLSEALDRYLPKQPEPEVGDGSDPRENLVRIVQNWIEADAAARAEREAERVAQGLPALPGDLDSAQREIERLRDENNALRFWDEPNGKVIPVPEGARVIDPPTSAIVPPGEIADLNMAPPMRTPPTIEHEPVPGRKMPAPGLSFVPGIHGDPALPGAETERRRQAAAARRDIDHKIMTARSRVSGEPQPSVGNEIWRGQ